MRKYLLIALIYLMGCESPSECIEHYFSDNYRSYFYFNEGSYWIYEDTILGITDSVYLVSQTIEFDEDCRPSTQPHEVLYHIFTSSYFKGNDNYQWYAGGNAELEDYYGQTLNGMYMDPSTPVSDSMYVNGVWYKNVMADTLSSGNKYLRAKGIGLIKKEFNFYPSENDTLYRFNLVRYHLN